MINHVLSYHFVLLEVNKNHFVLLEVNKNHKMFVKKEFLIIGRCCRSFRNRKGQKKVLNQNPQTMFCLSAPIQVILVFGVGDLVDGNAVCG